MDLNYSPEQLAFANEVREFTRANLDPAIARKVLEGSRLEREDFLSWHRALHKKGWVGVGVFLGYGRKEDYFRIYELDPVVEKFAREQFWFLNGTPAKTDVVIGDGRLNLERDAPQQFDLLSLDAFSSDAIPMHLMTREALRMYRKHVKPDGVIVFNVTNRFIRLAPLLHEVAKAEGMTAILISDDPTEDIYSGTEYVLVTANKAFIEDKRFADAVKIEPIPGLKPWTDDFNNLFDVLK